MLDIIVPVLYGLSDYILLQTQVVMASCVISDFETRDKKMTVIGSVCYWFACVVIMLAVGILDYTFRLFIVSQMRLVLVWVFAVLWQLLFFKAKISYRIFSVFYTAIILLAGNAFCNIVDAVCMEYGVGVLPWLRANDNSIWVFCLIGLRKLLLYSLIWGIEFFALRRYIGNRWSAIVSKTVVALYGFLALVTWALFWIEINAPEPTFIYYMMIFCCELAFSVLALIVVVILEQKTREEKQRAKMEADLELTHKLWKLDKKQYEFLKDNIEIINIKCHDMRHYINAGCGGTEAVRKEMNALSDSISAYDSLIRTGNPVCDITLSNKSMECMEKGIDFICIVDGAALHFVDEVSLYSLLGNAVQNAIEHVERFEDPDKRLITLNVSRKDTMVVINVENVLEGELTLEDGLPKTDKEDVHYHGFGMKSMRSTAERYGGGLEVLTEEGLFRLVIVLPYREVRA